MSETQDNKCPKCSKTNPVGAKFCAGCANPLTASQSTPDPIPVGGDKNTLPPGRPNMGGLMGQMGGKSDQRQVEGDVSSLYTAAMSYFNQREGTEIKSQYAPQQVSASVIFKDFLATLNSPVRMDTEVSITPAGAGVNSVSIASKIDWGSTSMIWVMSAIMLMSLLFLFNPYGTMTMMYLIIFVIGSIFTVMLINTRGPKLVADDFYTYLRANAGSSKIAEVSVPQAKQSPVAPAAPEPARSEQTPEQQETSEEVEPMQRIQQLGELNAKGYLSDEEFEAKKAELLARI
ncbi:MAG: SHOCT domain-containing protein [Pseudomonadaceae bacterium]|nr:SHOCT domain-containing protein [Pseudomonadaceae bacterium]